MEIVGIVEPANSSTSSRASQGDRLGYSLVVATERTGAGSLTSAIYFRGSGDGHDYMLRIVGVKSGTPDYRSDQALGVRAVELIVGDTDYSNRPTGAQQLAHRISAVLGNARLPDQSVITGGRDLQAIQFAATQVASHAATHG
jgi:hypothetical protein